MLNLSRAVKIFLGLEPVDLRKGFDSLAALVETVLAEDPLSGQLFVFRNRRADRVKVLYWDGDGYAIWCKKLESHYPHLLLFTEIGSSSDNLARRPAAAGGVDSIPPRIARRRPMLRDITVSVPPRAQFSAGP